MEGRDMQLKKIATTMFGRLPLPSCLDQNIRTFLNAPQTIAIKLPWFEIIDFYLLF